LNRDELNLHYEVSLDPVEAILGTKKHIKIPVLGNKVIDIPAGTQHGEIFKLKNDGVKHVQKDIRGDLLITINIKIPKKLSKKEHEYYVDIAKEKDIEINEKSFLGKIFD
jgi:molecular chaperone DnaJ